MNKMRLRPHHLAVLRSLRAKSSGDRKPDDPVLTAIFGVEFSRRLAEFVSELTDDVTVELVSTNDDLCRATQCPYFAACDAGSYRQVQDMMISKAPVATPPGVLETLHHSSPDTEDAKACVDLGVEVGKTYRLGALCSTKRSN